MVDKWQPVTVRNATVEDSLFWDAQVVQLSFSAAVILLAFLFHRWVSKGAISKERLAKPETLLSVPVTDDKMKPKMFRAHGKDMLSCTQCSSFTIKDPVDRIDTNRRTSNK